jgi:Domain of unknown function (DUF2382)
MMLSKRDDIEDEEGLLRSKERYKENPPQSNDAPSYQPGDVEYSAPLESSVSLESPRVRYVRTPVAVQPVPIAKAPIDTPPVQAFDQHDQPQLAQDGVSAKQEVLSLDTSSPIMESIPNIQLLDERIVVDRIKRKVGEVVVRKEIETQIVEVPIQRERLIVEQIGPEYKQLALVELGQPQVIQVDSTPINATSSSQITRAEFTSIQEAIAFLRAIVDQPNLDLQAVQVQLVTKSVTP